MKHYKCIICGKPIHGSIYFCSDTCRNISLELDRQLLKTDIKTMVEETKQYVEHIY